MYSRFIKFLSMYLAVAMFVIGIAPRVDASFVASGSSGVISIDRETDLQKIRGVLENRMVRDRLEQLGFTQEQIQDRLGKLDDQQIHEFAQKLDDIRVGGDGLGAVIAVLVIIILIIVILNLTGHKVLVR